MPTPIPKEYQDDLAKTFMAILATGSALGHAIVAKDKQEQAKVMDQAYEAMSLWVEPDSLRVAAFHLQRHKLEHLFNQEATQP